MGNRLTLGITTLGDLLLKNRITKTDNGNALDGIKLTIPEYQRPYKWTAKNANQLLDLRILAINMAMNLHTHLKDRKAQIIDLDGGLREVEGNG